LRSLVAPNSELEGSELLSAVDLEGPPGVPVVLAPARGLHDPVE
jgi:hypothetical protein